MIANNLRIRRPNCETDPSITKKVNQRGGFTAIDAYHQILNATKFFGPVGDGWGWRIESIDILTGLPVTIFGGNGSVESNPGGNSDKINALVLDDVHIYAAKPQRTRTRDVYDRP